MAEDERETDAELVARHQAVKKVHAKAVAAWQRARIGTSERSRKAQWAGCLNFTLLQIEAEMHERGLL